MLFKAFLPLVLFPSTRTVAAMACWRGKDATFTPSTRSNSRVQGLITRQSRNDLAVRPHLLFLKHAGTQ